MNRYAEATDDTRATPMTTVLIVDDAPENLSFLGHVLEPLYRVRVANSGARALVVAASEPRPELILLDYMMPSMNGVEVLRHLQAEESTRGIPVIFVTAADDRDCEAESLRLGAVDYITKPVNPEILLARVKNHVELKQARDRLALNNEWLESEVRRRTAESTLVRNLTVNALACMAEARDDETGQHIVRTREYVRVLAHELAGRERFRSALEGERLDMVVKAAPLHDIGKVGIPDAILLKPGRLTADEFDIIKTHPVIGAKAIKKAMELALVGLDAKVFRQASQPFEFLECAHEICLGHHEKWNGSGYPSGLAGDAIPVSARLMALADVFDALTTPRVYKPPMSFDQAKAIIRDGRGEHFDPDVVDTFLACTECFNEIRRRYVDSVPP
jgi:putative two-component system response regulator